MNQWKPLSKHYDSGESNIEIKGNSSKEYCFCIGADLQNRDYVQKESVAIINRAKESGIFFIHIGDMTHWGTEAGWAINLEALKPLYNNFDGKNKYFALPGNHEWQEDPLLERYNQVMDMPHNKFYYSIKFGPAHIIMVTTGYHAYDKEFAFTKSNDCRQYQWFLKEVEIAKKDTNISWIIACTHYPDDALTAGETWEPSEDGADFAQACIENNITLCYTGHNHIYERTAPLNKQYQKSPGGTIFITTGGMGAVFSKLKTHPRCDHIEKIIENEFHFVKVTVKKNSIESRMINDSGKTLDQVILKK